MADIRLVMLCEGIHNGAAGDTTAVYSCMTYRQAAAVQYDTVVCQLWFDTRSNRMLCIQMYSCTAIEKQEKLRKTAGSATQGCEDISYDAG